MLNKVHPRRDGIHIHKHVLGAITLTQTLLQTPHHPGGKIVVAAVIMNTFSWPIAAIIERRAGELQEFPADQTKGRLLYRFNSPKPTLLPIARG